MLARESQVPAHELGTRIAVLRSEGSPQGRATPKRCRSLSNDLGPIDSRFSGV